MGWIEGKLFLLLLYSGNNMGFVVGNNMNLGNNMSLDNNIDSGIGFYQMFPIRLWACSCLYLRYRSLPL